ALTVADTDAIANNVAGEIGAANRRPVAQLAFQVHALGEARVKQECRLNARVSCAEAETRVASRRVGTKLERGDQVILAHEGPLGAGIEVAEALRPWATFSVHKTNGRLDEDRQVGNYRVLEVPGQILHVHVRRGEGRSRAERRRLGEEEFSTLRTI